jgi:hypothetical protein
MSVSSDAKRNLELAGLFNKDSDYGGMLGKAVLKLVETHFAEGHSGFSHEMAIHIFNKVVKNHALTIEFYNEQKEKLQKFAMENMGEPWKDHLLEEMLGPRPTKEQENNG